MPGTMSETRRMDDDVANGGPADPARINIHEAREVRYWSKALGITEAQLMAAVGEAGVMAEDVRRHLESNAPGAYRHS